MYELVYLASPYSKYPGGREEAYTFACKKAAELMLQGYNVFCPIAHSHPIETIGGITPEQATHDFWLKQDFAVLDRCDALFVYKMPGWDTSHGVNEEVKRATRRQMKIIYLEWEGYTKELTSILRAWAAHDE